MSVTLQDVEHIAALAHLDFTVEEKERMQRDLNEVLAYMEQLNALDTSNVEPLAQVNEGENVFREDEVGPSLSTADALLNAPSRMEEYFTVPKVIGS